MTNRTVIALAFTCVLLAGCAGTVVPVAVESEGPSMSENEPNSGFLGFNRDGSGIITRAAYDRYCSLVKRYGKRFDPPLKVPWLGEPVGIRPISANTYVIDAQHINYFKAMARWKRSGQ